MLTKITYPTKTNNPSDAENIRKFQAIDANEVKTVVNNMATSVDQINDILGITQGSNSIGSFVSLTVLNAAYPDGADGAYAIIDDGQGGTPNIALYNAGGSVWELAVPDESIIWVANVGALPGTGISQKLYITLDSGDFYIWNGSSYDAAGPSVTVVSTYILNNGNRYLTQKGYGNVGTGFETGDTIQHRDAATMKMYFYYVKDGNLTLPADFSDFNKVDKYSLTGPMIS